MKIAVHGATGAQGAPVAKALREAGHDVVAIARAASADDTSRVAADLEDQPSLEAAYANADAVFLHLPIPSDPEAPGRWIPAILGALANSKVKRVVLSTSGASVEDAGPHPMLQGRLAGMKALYEGLQGAVSSVVVLAPRLFLENLLLPFVAGPLQSEGVLAYPLPADKPVSWISHRDVAEAAVDALEGRAEDGVYDLGYNALTGQQLADQLGTGLGSAVSYEAITPAEFSLRATPVLGEQVAAGVGALYEAFASDHTLEISAEAQQLGLDRRLGIKVWSGEVLGQMKNDQQIVAEAVRDALNRWLRAFNERDLDALMSYYDPDAVYANSGSPLMTGGREIRPWFETALGGETMKVLFKEETLFTSSDMAFLGGKYHFHMQEEDGLWQAGEAGRVGLLFRRNEKGQWLLLHDMDNNPPDAVPADFVLSEET